jgi:hypothetical protein
MSLHPSAAFHAIEAASERRGIDHDQLRESLLRDALVIGERDQDSALNQVQREIPGALLKVPPVETACVEETKPQILNRFHAGRFGLCVSGELLTQGDQLLDIGHGLPRRITLKSDRSTVLDGEPVEPHALSACSVSLQ